MLSARSFRRSRLRTLLRLLLLSLLTFTFIDILRLLSAYKIFSTNLLVSTINHPTDLPRSLQNQTVYISAQFWTSEAVLAEFWLEDLLALINVLGPQNVYVSILESGSLDNSADAIRWLDVRLGELGVERTVITDSTTHLDAVRAGSLNVTTGKEKDGWVVTGESKEGEKELRRIPYLSELRNRGLEPLIEMDRQQGRRFDKVLFLNDVHFRPSDILTLLNTNKGNFDVACGIDFHLPPALYDTFALRDSHGVGPVMSVFPYFKSEETRMAILRGEAALVKSCWNGVLISDARPYYDQISRAGERVDGLRYRGIHDSLAIEHLEASECCLIHADLMATGMGQRGIWINPAVRVGYTVDAYKETHRGTQQKFVSATQYVVGVWRNRIARHKVDAISSSAGQGMNVVYSKIKKWKEEAAKQGVRREEVGGFCTIQEMHILVWNGWKHIWP